jgi:hypothetical protein
VHIGQIYAMRGWRARWISGQARYHERALDFLFQALVEHFGKASELLTHREGAFGSGADPGNVSIALSLRLRKRWLVTSLALGALDAIVVFQLA